MNTKLNTSIFALAVLVVGGLGFWSGYLLAPSSDPYAPTAKAMGDFQQWRGQQSARALDVAVDIVCALDHGDYENAKQTVNAEINQYLMNPSSFDLTLEGGNAFFYPYPVSQIGTRLARHRSRFPVAYDDPMQATYISNLLDRARGGDTETQNTPSDGTR